MVKPEVLYIAYGSNAAPKRFRARVGPWLSREAAWIEEHRLRFASSVRSEGGGGAVIDPFPGERVAGVLYGITREQMDAMDREEFDPSRDVSHVGRRLSVEVTTADGARHAEVYTVRDDGGWLAPSQRYLDFILEGLRSVGHGEEALARVRAAAGQASQ